MATIVAASRQSAVARKTAGEVLSDSGWSTGEKALVILTLALSAVLSFASLRTQSLTVNEIVDIPSGLGYWQKQDTRLNVEHPPLLKMLAVVPLLFTNVKLDYNDPSYCGSGSAECEWMFGKKIFEQWNTDPQRLVILARIPMLAMTLALGLLLYWMGRKLAGPWGGGLSLALFATAPFYLGLGPLAVTDIGLPLFVLAAVWTLASLWNQPSGKRMVWFALSLSGALLSKFSAVMLVPALLLMGIYFRVRSRERKGPEDEQGSNRGLESWTKKYAPEAYGVVGIISAGLMTYLFYLVTCWNSDPVYIFSERARAFGTWNKAGIVTNRISLSLTKHQLIARVLKPAWLYLIGILDVYYRIDRKTYILGKWRAHGVWFYFPVVSFFKLTPGMMGCLILLAAFAALYAVKRRHSSNWVIPRQYRPHLEAMIGALLVFGTSAITSTLNIGIRHFSVPLSIMFLLCALVVPLVRAVLAEGLPRKLGFTVCGALAFSSLSSALLAYPHYISYYNFFRLGTPKQEIANNSNLYWGQSLIDLENFRAAHHISKIYTDTRTFRPAPDVYVSGANEWECDEPEPPAPEWAAVTANFLLRDPPTCAGLFRYSHWFISGGSIVVFHITDSTYATNERAYRRDHPDRSWSVVGW